MLLVSACAAVTAPVASADTGAAPNPDAAGALVRRYVDAVIAGDLAGAAASWSPAYLAASRSLAIVYPDAPVPWDMASPLLLQLELLRAGVDSLACGVPEIQGDCAFVAVAPIAEPAAAPYRYAVVLEEGRPVLANALWAATRGWPVRTSRYFRFLCRDPGLLAPAAVASLDTFVDATLQRFGVGESRRAHLAAAKIPYVLADEATVADLTGYATKGMGDLAAGMIVSSHFPHYHEAAHLLVNYALEAAPLHPLPSLQEGLASLLGGRWGQSPAVILHMAWANAEMGFADVGDILTRGGFQGAAGGPNAAYPAAALLCDTIVAAAGWPAVLELQRTLAEGPGPGRDPNAIAAAIGRACRWPSARPLAALTAACEERRMRYRRAGVAPGGDIDAAEVGRDGGVALRRVGDDLVFTAPAADGMTALLPARSAGADGTRSPLFAELFPARAYAGETAGVRCSAHSISVYDFTTNRLVGVWVGDFAGEGGGAADGPDRLRFRVRADLLPGLADVPWVVVAP